METLLTPSAVIDALDGTAAFARLTGKKASTVSTWRKRGFPDDIKTYLIVTEALKHKKLRASPTLWGIEEQLRRSA